VVAALPIQSPTLDTHRVLALVHRAAPRARAAGSLRLAPPPRLAHRLLCRLAKLAATARHRLAQSGPPLRPGGAHCASLRPDRSADVAAGALAGAPPGPRARFRLARRVFATSRSGRATIATERLLEQPTNALAWIQDHRRGRAHGRAQQGALHVRVLQRGAGAHPPAAARRGAARSRPNVWFGNVERVASERIGRETVTYVSNIYKYYVAYRLVLEENERLAKAKRSVGAGGAK
jgi:hypothetical protein